jgi:hypothetical protein
MKNVSGLFYWCNGQHYVETQRGGCPWSGYWNHSLFQRLQRLRPRGPIRSYQELLTGGLAEDHLLQLLLVPQELVSSIAAVGCDAPTAGELADLVAQRNRLALELFPRGKLRALLDRPARQGAYWYARRPGDEATWILVDEGGLRRRPAVSKEDLAEVKAFQAQCIGVSWSEVQACVADDGRAASSKLLALRRFRVSEDFPPLGLSEEGYHRGRRRELFRLRHYPVIPAGHLVFPEA